MPIMKTDRSTKYFLPSTENEANEDDRAFVMLRDRIRVETLRLIGESDTDIDKAINGMLDYITDWNFTDADGNKLPIDKTTIVSMDFDDYSFIKEKLQDHVNGDAKGLDKNEKKRPISTSKEFTTLTPPSETPATITPPSI